MRLPIVLLMMFYASASFAGNVIRYEVSGVPNVAAGKQIFYVEGNRIKQTVSAHLYYLYDGSTDTLQLVDTSKRAYYPMSRTFYKDVSKTVSDQEKRIKDLLAKQDKLPEQAQASLQQALDTMQTLKQSTAMLDKKANLSVKLDGPTGKSKYKNVECYNYQVVSGESKANVCYANFKQLGLPREVVKSFNGFQRFLAHISGYNSLFAVLDDHLPVNVAIKEPLIGTISFSGAPSMPMARDLFELPVGFQRISMKNPLNNLNN